MSILCQRVTQASRSARALEIIVQARWVECFNDEIAVVMQNDASLTPTKARMLVLGEVCRDFGWTEKELRNKL